MIEDFTGFQSCVDHFLGLLALFVRIILTHELSGLYSAKYLVFTDAPRTEMLPSRRRDFKAATT